MTPAESNLYSPLTPLVTDQPQRGPTFIDRQSPQWPTDPSGVQPSSTPDAPVADRPQRGPTLIDRRSSRRRMTPAGSNLDSRRGIANQPDYIGVKHFSYIFAPSPKAKRWRGLGRGQRNAAKKPPKTTKNATPTQSQGSQLPLRTPSQGNLLRIGTWSAAMLLPPNPHSNSNLKTAKPPKSPL